MLKNYVILLILTLNLTRTLATLDCFCYIKQQIRKCPCTELHTIDRFNEDLHGKLVKLLNQNYFKYFYYNNQKSCQFWNVQDNCKTRDCSVEICDEHEIPKGLLNENTNCIDSTISETAQNDFKLWQNHDNFCYVDEEFCPECQYVDLTLNPERYTGYSGPSAHRIWNAIYEENCFKREKYEVFLKNSCLEERVFFRAISGLHSSISIHLSSQFPSSQNSFLKTFEPNLQEFRRRFDHSKGQAWLQNLFFVYLLELRAISKHSEFWLKTLNTGTAKG